MKHAGLSTAVFTKAERDYDDGRLEYELEFHTDSAAYEVTVDAATGRVLDYEKENLRGGTGSTDIGAQAAKAAGPEARRPVRRPGAAASGGMGQ